jgi:hypothetical protein
MRNAESVLLQFETCGQLMKGSDSDGKSQTSRPRSIEEGTTGPR